MNIKDLQRKLNEIPPTGAINKARRREIIILINRLAEEGKV